MALDRVLKGAWDFSGLELYYSRTLGGALVS